MSNIHAIYPGRDLTFEEVLAGLREINDRLFGGLLTVEPHPDATDVIIECRVEDLPQPLEDRRWSWCSFEFYYRGPRRVTTSYPAFDWHSWLWTVMRHEFAHATGGRLQDEDDPCDDPWAPRRGRWPTYKDWLRWERQRLIDSDTPYDFDGEYDHLMGGCPSKLLSVLEGRAAQERTDDGK